MHSFAAKRLRLERPSICTTRRILKISHMLSTWPMKRCGENNQRQIANSHDTEVNQNANVIRICESSDSEPKASQGTHGSFHVRRSHGSRKVEQIAHVYRLRREDMQQFC